VIAIIIGLLYRATLTTKVAESGIILVNSLILGFICGLLATKEITRNSYHIVTLQAFLYYYEVTLSV
jgi:hypothetical protein